MNLADETDSGYAALEKKCLDELDLVNDTVHSYEAEIEEFQQVIAGEKQRESIVASTSTSPNNSFRVDNTFTPKLEEIKVPKFNGEILNFPNFKGLYENLVHNNGALSGVQKMHYLKKAFEDGKSEKLIRDFPLSETAYAEAWALVLSRFENKRAVLRTLFKHFADLKPINSPAKLRDLLDEVEIILRGIKAAGERIDTFSKFITYFVSTKLDKKTSEDWENSITATRTFPLFNDLERFIQGRMFSAESSHEDKMEKVAKPQLKLNPKSKPKSAFAISQKSESCALCKGSHLLQNCTGFLSKSAYDRYNLTKTMKLCFVCFGDHGIKGCPNKSSPYKCNCGKLHHHLLHFNFSSSNDREEFVAQNKRREESKRY